MPPDRATFLNLAQPAASGRATDPSPVASAFRRAGGAPLYQELARWLEQKVLSGEFPTGSKIPGDTQLAKELGVSVITVRAAMKALRDKNLIARYAGKGTFVVDNVEVRATWGLSSTEELIALGAGAIIRLLSAGYVRAPEPIAAKFGFPKDKMFRCRRLRIHNREPFVVTDVYVPEPMAGQMAKIDLASALDRHRLVHVVLEHVCNFSIIEIRQAMGAELARDYTATALKLHEGTPVLTAERDYFTSDGTLVQVGISSYRVDHYKYMIDLKRVATPRM